LQKPKIYIIEDDDALATELAHLLALSNYDTVVHDFVSTLSASKLLTTAQNGKGKAGEGGEPAASIIAARAAAAEPDCVLLDLALPGADGLAVCKAFKEARPATPVIVLTSSTAEFDEVMALNIGAADFISKPYRPAVLLARLSKVLDLAQATCGQAEVYEYAGLTFYMAMHRIKFAGREGQLTHNEAIILRALMLRPGCVVSRSELMCQLWDSDAFVDDNTLTVNVNRLRRALEDLGAPADFVRTHRGAGYSL
jgi:DNA-binding response OmpR family regulator